MGCSLKTAIRKAICPLASCLVFSEFDDILCRASQVFLPVAVTSQADAHHFQAGRQRSRCPIINDDPENSYLTLLFPMLTTSSGAPATISSIIMLCVPTICSLPNHEWLLEARQCGLLAFSKDTRGLALLEIVCLLGMGTKEWRPS
jgi:hypothetical protein